MFTNKYCLVPLTTLRASPYSLAYNALVVAKVRARNSVGYSAYSTANSAGA